MVDIRADVKRVLVVDDSATLRTVTRVMLDQLGFECDTVASAEEAIELTIMRRYDLILMDLQMPNVDGAMTTRRIRNSPENKCTSVPIVAFTAHPNEEDIVHAYNSGMNDCLPKPITLETLKTVLGRWHLI